MRRSWLLCLLPAALALGCGSQGGLRFPFGGESRAEPDSTLLRLAAVEQRLERIEAAIGRLEGLERQNHAATQADLDALRAATDALGEKLSAIERRGPAEPRAYGAPATSPLLPASGDVLVRLDEAGRSPGGPGGPGSIGPLWGEAASGPGREPAAGEEPAGGAPREAATNLSGPPEGARGDAPAEGEQLYQVAYQDLMEENYQLALINFRAFLERYPQTRLSDNAQYWIGEVYYGQHQFQAAIEEFRRVIEEYPNGDKVPAAYYKIALCFQNQRDVATARRYLEFVLRQYPNSREARLAEATLADLR